jgi:hypothetical protein
MGDELKIVPLGLPGEVIRDGLYELPLASGEVVLAMVSTYRWAPGPILCGLQGSWDDDTWHEDILSLACAVQELIKKYGLPTQQGETDGTERQDQGM